MRLWHLAWAVSLPLLAGADWGRYLLISTPRLSKVSYKCVGGSETYSKAVRPLITTGIRSPQGLAVTQVQNQEEGKHSTLYIADPDSKKVWGAEISGSDGSLNATSVKTAVNNVEARWVAVDSEGNLFITDERNSLILKVIPSNLFLADKTPTVLYRSTKTPQVSAPGGIALDNFHLFWTNKAQGVNLGSVVRGLEDISGTNALVGAQPIAKNVDKVYGVCVAQQNVFYTASDTTLYGVKKDGGAITMISNKMLQPRGCAYDGDGTVYVADKNANSVYSFPANMATIEPQILTKTADLEDAFGLAVISAAVPRGPAAFAALLAAAVACVASR